MSGSNQEDFTKKDLKQAYDQYFESLRGFLYYKTGDIGLAEDIVQEVFIRLWEKRASVEVKTLKSFLFTIANNLMINHMNHLKVVARHEDEVTSGQRSERKSPQFVLEEKEFEQKLNECIQSMPEGCREVFLMNRMDKMKYGEIAEIVGITVKAVEKRMSKALTIIREQIGMKV